MGNLIVLDLFCGDGPVGLGLDFVGQQVIRPRVKRTSLESHV